MVNNNYEDDDIHTHIRQFLGRLKSQALGTDGCI